MYLYDVGRDRRMCTHSEIKVPERRGHMGSSHKELKKTLNKLVDVGIA
jgi:hypothetical protein